MDASEELDDLPDSLVDRVIYLQKGLVAQATDGEGAISEEAYALLRRELMNDPRTKDLLPDLVRTNRHPMAVRGDLQRLSPSWQPRREHIWKSFGPLLDRLEGPEVAPADEHVADTLASFDPEGVHRAWTKALDRRTHDPEGAVTAARSLLETVCKRILDEAGAPYSDSEDLPKLYRMTAEALNLAPSQHTEETFRTILGNCQQVVNNLATIRNRIGDAHGQGRKPVRPLPRHAALVVNLAGAMSTFLVETRRAKSEELKAATAAAQRRASSFARRSASSFSSVPTCPRVHFQVTGRHVWRSSSSAHRSPFATGLPSDFRQPRAFHPGSHSVAPLQRNWLSLTMVAGISGATFWRKRSALIAAVISIRELVVRGSPPTTWNLTVSSSPWNVWKT
jgi:hypothetical protein